MTYVLTFVSGLLIGLVAGLLIYRKNSVTIKATEDKGRYLLDALKGR